MASTLVFITVREKLRQSNPLSTFFFYHETENEHLVDNIKQHPNAFTEKKVEVFHSVIRRLVQTNHCQTAYLSMHERKFPEFSNNITADNNFYTRHQLIT